MARLRVRVRGTVQGVGFRPHVYRRATSLGLAGFVRNDSQGVLVEVEGRPDRIEAFRQLLTVDPPPLSRITSVVATRIPSTGSTGPFSVVTSHDDGAADVPVGVDTATCEACIAEIDDPLDRRFRYPFTNCTDCGPRYTIVQSVPYDRQSTTMSGFAMCAACRDEYDDPADRRFHAQPNACPACGPRLDFGDARGDEALKAAVSVLRAGGIVAVKGLGGYHLAADATDPAAVTELRRRKARDHKPFAVMVPDLAAAAELGVIGPVAATALSCAARPIVLVPRRREAAVVEEIAPGSPHLGIFLPYTPLHHLLLQDVGRPLVMTSGNHSDEPIAHEDADARRRLGPISDGILGHDRPIHIRCDDSIVRVTPRGPLTLRRSRGLSPEPIVLPVGSPRPILAVGAELKSTVAVVKGSTVVPSHHIGDLEHLPAYRSFLQALHHLQTLHGLAAEVVVHDLHPDYLSTQAALDLAADLGIESLAVQHHHAHVAACMVEHGRTDPVVALAFDGLGYGTDGTLWGGEVLVADLTTFERVHHLPPVAMPGGSAAVREPWRMAVAWSMVDDATLSSVPGPQTTSMGRLFDAVAAVVTGRRTVSYEAQAAMELEALALTVPRGRAPRYDADLLDPRPLLDTIMSERNRGTSPTLLAAGFHEAIGAAAARTAVATGRARGLDTVALTGGVFQNERLTDVVEGVVHEAGMQVLVHGAVPPNDAAISLGQAGIAAAREAEAAGRAGVGTVVRRGLPPDNDRFARSASG